MTPKAARVMTGFLALSDAEKQEVVDEINRYVREKPDAIKSIGSIEFEKRARARVLVGPVATGGCPCCGK